jgi:hypothetical protein
LSICAVSGIRVDTHFANSPMEVHLVTAYATFAVSGSGSWAFCGGGDGAPGTISPAFHRS